MKKVLALLLCLSLMVGAMAGCNNNGGGSSTASGTSSAAGESSEGTPAETSEDGVTNTGTKLPIVNEPVTITVAKERHMLDTTKSYNEKRLGKTSPKKPASPSSGLSWLLVLPLNVYP